MIQYKIWHTIAKYHTQYDSKQEKQILKKKLVGPEEVYLVFKIGMIW